MKKVLKVKEEVKEEAKIKKEINNINNSRINGKIFVSLIIVSFLFSFILLSQLSLAEINMEAEMSGGSSISLEYNYDDKPDGIDSGYCSGTKLEMSSDKPFYVKTKSVGRYFNYEVGTLEENSKGKFSIEDISNTGDGSKVGSYGYTIDYDGNPTINENGGGFFKEVISFVKKLFSKGNFYFQP